MDPWQVELFQNVKLIMRSTIMDWGAVINKLGMSEKDRSEWAKIFENECKVLMQELMEEIKSTEMNLSKKIENLQLHSEDLCARLNIKMPRHGTQYLGLYDEEKSLIRIVEKLQQQVDIKVNEINNLKDKQSKICHCLGRNVITLPDNPLPSEEEIDQLRKHVEELENERFLYEEKFMDLKCNMIDFAKKLEWTPVSEFEKMVMYKEDNLFIVSDANMIALEELHNSLKLKLQLIKKEISNLREKVTSLWEILAEDIKYRDNFLQKYKENSLDSLAAFECELERCNEMKKVNIEVFVNALRKEIQFLWDKCRYTHHQRNEFEFFNEDFYTEELLTLHDLELNKMKEKYNENREIYDILDEREKLCSELLELEEKANGPDRYKNRGGCLLKEAKDRSSLFKKISKLENKALNLIRTYEEETENTFLYWGETMDTAFRKYREDYEEKKKLKLSVSKQKRDLTPGTSYLSTNSTISLSARKTPITTCSSTKLRITPSTKTAAKRNIKPLFVSQESTKSVGLNKVENRRRSRLNPPIIKVNNRTICRPRYSITKKKRMAKLRRISKFLKQSKREHPSDSDSDYDMFEGIVPISETSIVDLVS